MFFSFLSEYYVINFLELPWFSLTFWDRPRHVYLFLEERIHKENNVCVRVRSGVRVGADVYVRASVSVSARACVHVHACARARVGLR